VAGGLAHDAERPIPLRLEGRPRAVLELRRVHQLVVEARHGTVRPAEAELGVVHQGAEEGPVPVQRAKIERPAWVEQRAQPEPAGQTVTALRPAEDPGDGT